MGMRRSCPVLVGRDAELRALEQAFAERGSRPVILLGGEAGVGKTRLVAELAASVVLSGAATAVGACVHLGAETLPFAPFADGLGRYVDALGERASELIGASWADLAPLLSDVGLAVGPATGANPTEPSRGRLYEAVRRLLDRAPSPLLLVVEDVHWADQSSLELLAYLASRLREGRTTILATFRTDELHRRHPLVPVLAELARGGRSARVDIERLSPDEVAEMVRIVEGDAPASRVAAIAARSDGNPFLVEELLSVADGPGAPLPSSLRDVLLARLSRLGDPARRVLGIVAMLGRPADARLLEAAWDPDVDLDAAVREAVDRAVLSVDPTTGRLWFRHALIGEAVEDDLLPGERIRLHADLARILVADPSLASPTPAGADGEIAHHLLGARDLPAALRACVRAGQTASAARAYPEARRHLEHAIELSESVPLDVEQTGLDRIGLLDATADSAFRCGDAARAVALGRQAVAEAEQVVTPERLSYLLNRLLEWLELNGEPAEVFALAERAVGLIPADPPTPALARALMSLATARMRLGRNGDGMRIARDAVLAAEACDAIGYEACARAQVAISLIGLGRDDEAIAEIERAVALAERSRGPAELGVAHVDRPAVYSIAGRFEELGRVLDESRAALELEGLGVLAEPFLASDEVELLLYQGKWCEAEALLERSLDAGPVHLPRTTLLMLRGLLRVRRGRVAEGTEDLREAVAVRPPVDPETQATGLAGLAEAALEAGDPRSALTRIDEGLEILAQSDEAPGRAYLYALGLRAAADLAERARARREVPDRDVEDMARRLVADLEAARSGTLVEGAATGGRLGARVLWGRAEDARRRGVATARDWGSAADALAATGEPHVAAWCRWQEAEAALADGERGRAATVLRDVRAWANLTGATSLSVAVDALARRGRLQLDEEPAAVARTVVADETCAPGPIDPYGLSRRELEVLEMLLDGRTNREIGAALFITDKTASTHVTHILDKLGVTSRGAAAAVAARAGIGRGAA